MVASLRTPIAVFAFARPRHLEAAMKSLARCDRFDECTLHIFCDGPRSDADRAAVAATRLVAHTWAVKLGGEVVEEPVNTGLALSISKNVTRLCDQHGRVIVVEDDLYVSTDFIDFMLRGLEVYADAEAVFQIGGFMYPIRDLPLDRGLFLPYASSWGWATWQRAWSKYDFSMTGWERILADPQSRKRFDLNGAYPFSRGLVSQAHGADSTWDIQWYFTMFMANGLGLYPPRSLVRNGGIFGPATHRGMVNHSPEPIEEFDQPRLDERFELPADVAVDGPALEQVSRYLRTVRHLEGHTRGERVLYAAPRLARWLGRIWMRRQL